MSDFGYNEQETAERSVDAESIKCSACGSNMVFHPESQTLYCEHCGTKQSFANDTRAEELDIRTALMTGRGWEADRTVVFACENCNAKVVLQKSETAKSCPFCGTAHVKQTDELAGLKPNGLIPFAFGDETALNLSKTWARKRFFAPRDFKKKLNADNVKGVYAPCFTFDSNTTSYYEGRLGETRTRTVGSGKNRRVQTYTVWYNVRGTFNRSYDDVLITSGTKFSQRELDKISPFDTNGGKAYEENYLLGFMAYHYDVELTDCWQNAKNLIDGNIRRGILSQYRHDKVAYLNVSTSHSNVTYKYVMLPVYVGNFKYKKKLYNFFVNGSTGKVHGKTPKSFWKILATAILSVAVAVGACFIVSHLL
ncbi:MAG: hypothetical protein IJX16_06750 [Clostridia bacterium]|nr:hypothetical protein [Clostridia bacterium]